MYALMGYAPKTRLGVPRKKIIHKMIFQQIIVGKYGKIGCSVVTDGLSTLCALNHTSKEK